MKAAVTYGKGDMRVEEVPLPPAPPDSVRVRVMACGVCGTDRRIFRSGDHRAAYPVILGHEIAGVIDAISGEHEHFQIGDRVCVAPGHGCGECRTCRRGFPNVCTRPFPSLGYRVNGGFAEYIAVPTNIFSLGFVNHIPPNLSFQQAALSEIVACCINAQQNTPVRKDDIVLIVGAGPAGLIHSLLAAHHQAAKILITQRSRSRLDLAHARLPVAQTICSNEENVEQVVMDESNGNGADVVFVCAPSREAQEMALRLIAPRGRINFFGGLPKNDCHVLTNANDLHYREIFVAGASSSLPEGNRQALRLLADRIIDPEVLITHTFPLNQIHEAFDVLEQKSGIKVIVNPFQE